MGNRRLPGTVPAAFSASGQDVPPSPDVAEHNLAQIIGEAVALHLAQVLGPLVQQLQPHPACVLCVQARKQAEADYAIAAQNALQAAEPEPEAQLPDVLPSVTWMPLAAPGQPPSVLPVCYGHFQAGPQVRPVGLVAPDGRPIVAKG